MAVTSLAFFTAVLALSLAFFTVFPLSSALAVIFPALAVAIFPSSTLAIIFTIFTATFAVLAVAFIPAAAVAFARVSILLILILIVGRRTRTRARTPALMLAAPLLHLLALHLARLSRVTPRLLLGTHAVTVRSRRGR